MQPKSKNEVAPVGGVNTAKSAPHARRWCSVPVLALAGALGVGTFALSTTNAPVSAIAQETSGTVLTPYGRAPASFADIVEKVQGAVVSIHVTNEIESTSNRSNSRSVPGVPKGHPLEEFFKRFGGKPGGGGQRGARPSLAQGSGFIISPDGYVVTNNHVIDKASKISVSVTGEQKWDAELIGKDSRTDLALLKIKDDSQKFNFVRFSKKQARVGDWVIAVGNPFGLGGTVTAGIVSAKSRDIGSGPYDYLQIDAAVNRGNSGGPTFNLQGEVVGVNTAIFSPSGGNVGIAFAVPAKLATEVVSELRSSGSVSRGWLGVRIQNVTDDIAASLGMDKASGAMVTDITDGGPAEKSELKVGDAIVAVNESEIKNSRDLARKVAALEPNDVAEIRVLRDGRETTVDVRLGTFPGGKKLAKISKPKSDDVTEELKELGLTLAPSRLSGNPDAEGVIVTNVKPESEAAQKGIQAGDIILEVAGKKVEEPSDVQDGVSKAEERGRRAVLLRLQSGESQRFIALPLKKG